jgi:hypothetical protein
MRAALLFATLTAAVAAGFLACSQSEDPVEPLGDQAEAGGPVGLPSGTGPAGSGLQTGLPCDVQAVIENRCIACHAGESPPRLLDYDDLLKPSRVDPTKTLAEMSLLLMKSADNTMPPPPAEPPEADEIEVFEEWVAAGMPRGEMCTDPPPDGGTDGGLVTDAGPPDANACASGATWTGGNAGSPLMYPGRACLACHQVMGGPAYRAAGTVYSMLQEPDDCNGAGPPPQLTVIVTDANGRTREMPVNAAGNFFTRQPIRAPYRARVTDGTNTRVMQGSVTSGDCNSCHTAGGANGASGRILAP